MDWSMGESNHYWGYQWLLWRCGGNRVQLSKGSGEATPNLAVGVECEDWTSWKREWILKQLSLKEDET